MKVEVWAFLFKFIPFLSLFQGLVRGLEVRTSIKYFIVKWTLALFLESNFFVNKEFFVAYDEGQK